MPGVLGRARPGHCRDRQGRRRNRRLVVHGHGPLLPDGQIAPADDPMLEGYTTLGFLAAQTERLRSALLVTGVTYRHPGLLAKTVTTLDVLSGGRALLGIGAAWYEREHLGAGRAVPADRRSGSSGWRRRSRSACRCGATTTAPTRASTTSWPRRCAARAGPAAASADPDRRRRREEDTAAGGAVRRRLQPLRLRAREVAHKLDVLRATARPKAATTTRSRRPCRAGRTRSPTGTPSSASPSSSTSLGIEHIHLRTRSDDPAGYVARFGERGRSAAGGRLRTSTRRRSRGCLETLCQLRLNSGATDMTLSGPLPGCAERVITQTRSPPRARSRLLRVLQVVIGHDVPLRPPRCWRGSTVGSVR